MDPVFWVREVQADSELGSLGQGAGGAEWGPRGALGGLEDSKVQGLTGQLAKGKQPAPPPTLQAAPLNASLKRSPPRVAALPAAITGIN